MMWWIILAVILAVIIAIYLASTAGRLDRLHKRVDTGLLALDVQLRRRAQVAEELATSGLLDPGTCIVLGQGAENALADERDPVDRALVESDLSGVLDAVFGTREEVDALIELDGGQRFADQLSGAVHRVELSRRFYNDSVRACRAVRRQRLARWLGLAGHTALPRMCEMDDRIPAGFEAR